MHSPLLKCISIPNFDGSLSRLSVEGMDSFKQGWFSESNDLWPGMSLSLEVEEVLCKEKSSFQDIMVLKT